MPENTTEQVVTAPVADADPEGAGEATTEPTPDAGGETTEAEGWGLREKLEAQGVDVGDFADDDAALSSLVSAKSLVGRRNEDAEFGRQIRDLSQGKEEALRELLTGESKSEPAATTPDDDFDPLEASYLIREVDGKLVPADGAPRDIVQKYQAYQKKQARLLKTLVNDPEKAIGDYAAPRIEAEIKRQVKEITGQQTKETAVQTWFDKNAESLYPNGDATSEVYTPVGRVAAEYYEKNLASMPVGVERLQAALDYANAKQAKPKTSRANRQSTRTPDTAVPPPKNEPDVKDGESLFDSLMRAKQRLEAETGTLA